jgi:hypothetical protein
MSTYGRFVVMMFIFCHAYPLSNNDLPWYAFKKNLSFIILIEICMEGCEQFPCGLVALRRIFFHAR